MFNKNLKTILSVFILLTFYSTLYAQRHYAGASALELNVSVGNTDAFDTDFNFAFSNYLDINSYYKIGVEYSEQTFYVKSSEYAETAKSYSLVGNYYYTLFSDSKAFFFSPGGGIFIGYENIPSLNHYRENNTILLVGKIPESKTIAGIQGAVEVEFFFFRTLGLLADIREIYSPMSNMNKFQTQYSLGIKYIF